MKKVPARGPKNAKIVVVGESPGRQETQQGTPFVGPTGAELFKQLLAVGIDPAKCYLTNACKYEPGPGFKSNITKPKWFFHKGKVGNPTDHFIEGIAELDADLREINPILVISLGRFALWAMYQEDGIMKWRGSVVNAKIGGGPKTIFAYHPAFVLRQYNKMPLLNWDFQKAKIESGHREIRQRGREYLIDPTKQEIEEAVHSLAKSSLLTFDSEWYDSEHISCVGFTDREDWAICIPAGARGSVDAYNHLLDTDIRKIAQNSMFDVVNMRRAGITVRTKHSETGKRIIEDTMTAFNSCWGDIGQKDLGTMTTVYTDIPYYKDDLKIWGKTREDETLWEYNCKDNVVTHEIWNHLEQEDIPDFNATRGYELSMLTFNIMADSTDFGIRADTSGFIKMKKAQLALADMIEKELWKVVGWEPNMRSQKDVAVLCYDQLGVKERAKRTTKQEVLLDIAAQASARDETEIAAVMTAVVRIRRARNHVSKFMQDTVIDSDGRIRFNWNMAGTKNGRISAGKTYWQSGIPIQQAPPRIRKVFIADPGTVFLSHDLGQAEARIVAYLSEDDDLIEWMESGIDIHAKLGSMFPFGMSYEEIVEDEAKTGLSKVRYIAKKSRHALNYMMGPITFKDAINKEYLETGIGATLEQTKEWKNYYHAIHPNLQSVYWHWVKQQIRNVGTITNAVGRCKQFIGQWNDKMLRDAIAYYPQSTVADITHLGLYEVHQRADWIRILINMHDGTLFQVPKDRAEEAADIIKDSMTIPIIVNSQELTIPVDMKIGPCWYGMEKM